ncbi:hypothetical protein OAA60_00660 [Porticoccaceae bacterium]|nr:hypothetical protein [Porticoccaceae bacterium]
MSISHHTTPIILAQALDAVSTEQLVPLGTTVKTNDGGEAVYVQALSGVAQFAGVVINVDYTVNALSTNAVADGTGTSKLVGWAQTSAASGSYAWIQTAGRPKGNLASACADRVTLYTTAVAGVMDDATVSAALVAGVVSKTTISNATAVTLMVPLGAHIHPHANPA